MPELFSQTGHAPERLVVDWPDQFRTKVVLRWPDSQIRKYAEVRVDPDAVAIFTSRGEPVGAPLAPGRWPLDEGASIGLDWLADLLIDDSYYGAELYYVSTREGISAPFGGAFGEFTDPSTGAVVTVRGYGEFVYRVVEPWFLVSKLAEPGAEVANDDDLQPWIGQRVVAAVQAGLPSLIQQHGVLALEAVQAAVVPGVLDAVNAELDDYGVVIESIPQLTLNISEDDRARVMQLAHPPPATVPAESQTVDLAFGGTADPFDDDDDDDEVVGVDNMFMAAAMGMGFPDPDHEVFDPEPPPVPSIPVAEEAPGFPPPPPDPVDPLAPLGLGSELPGLPSMPQAGPPPVLLPDEDVGGPAAEPGPSPEPVEAASPFGGEVNLEELFASSPPAPVEPPAPSFEMPTFDDPTSADEEPEDAKSLADALFGVQDVDEDEADEDVEPEPVVDAEPEPVVDVAPEPEPEPIVDVAPEPEPDVDAEPEPVVDVVPEPEPVVDAEPEPVVDVAPEPEPEPVVDVAPEPEPEPVVDVAPEPEPEPVVDVAPEPEPEPVVDVAPEPEPEPVVDVAPEPEPVVDAEPEPVVDESSTSEAPAEDDAAMRAPAPAAMPAPLPVEPVAEVPAPAAAPEPAPAAAASAPRAKFCAHCGQPLVAGANFCAVCGAPVPVLSGGPAAATPPAEEGGAS